VQISHPCAEIELNTAIVVAIELDTPLAFSRLIISWYRGQCVSVVTT